MQFLQWAVRQMMDEDTVSDGDSHFLRMGLLTVRSYFSYMKVAKEVVRWFNQDIRGRTSPNPYETTLLDLPQVKVKIYRLPGAVSCINSKKGDPLQPSLGWRCLSMVRGSLPRQQSPHGVHWRRLKGLRITSP